MDKHGWVMNHFKAFCEVALPLGTALAAILRKLAEHGTSLKITTLRITTHNKVVVLEPKTHHDPRKAADRKDRKKAA